MAYLKAVNLIKLNSMGGMELYLKLINPTLEVILDHSTNNQ